MFTWVGDIVDEVEEAAAVVVNVAKEAVGGAMGVVGEGLGPIADAVSAIPVLGDAVEFVAPLAGPLGAFIGGPAGAMLGNAVANAFDDGGPNIMGVLDGALDAVGGALPPPIDGVADDLLDGGTLINAGMAVLGGGMPDIGAMADKVADKVGDAMGVDLGGIVGAATDLANGEMPDVGAMADKLGDAFGIDVGGAVGAATALANGEMPDLGDAIGAAKEVFGGFGLGGLESAITGAVVGTPAPATAGAEGAADGGGGGFGFGSGYDVGDYVTYCVQPPYEFNPIGEGGGGWLENILDKADDLPGTAFDWAHPAVGFPSNTGVVPPIVSTGDMPGSEPIQDFPDTDLDDLVFNMPGVNADSAARDALQQLAESGGLGAALAGMAPDDVTALVSRLVTPITPAAEAVQSDNDVIVDIDDGMTIPGGGTEGFNDPLGIGVDDITGEPVGAGVGADATGAAGADATAVPGADATADPATGQVAVDDFSIDAGIDAGGGADVSAPAEPEFVAPEPVESDFSESMAQADAAETQLDNDVDEFFTGLG